MYIKELNLKNYRNYEGATLSFENKVNVIIGENAQGKTNLMESMFVLALAKSYRTSNDKELIRFESEYAKIEGEIIKRNQRVNLQLVVSNKGKKAKINGLEQQRLSQYVGAMNVVMFAPEDLNLVKGSPQVRRKFIDMEIGQISPIYLYNLNAYQKLLIQRNHYLKTVQLTKKKDEALLDIFTMQLCEEAAKVCKKRFEFIQLLQQWAQPIHTGITRGIETLKIAYKPSVDVSEDMELSKIKEVYYESFNKVREREIQRGSTLIGPHRDDFVLYVNGKNVQTFGSQGQQRTAALSVKLAEIELIKSEVGEYPILLLDDVLSELDDYRQSHLLSTIQDKVQTFVTTTSVEGIEHETLKRANMISVSSGTII
ncbi:MAG: DNA replication/repair protein RecF [Bacillaceae bacterium]